MTPNIIFCGECAEVMSKLPADCIDLTVTSPPYDNLRDYNGYVFAFEAIAQQLYRVTKPGGVVVWVVADATIDGSETLTSFRQALYFREIGFNVHDTMIYKKLSGITMNHNRFEQEFEYMFIFSKKKPSVFNAIKIPCKGAGAGARPSKIIHSVNGKKLRSGQPRTNAKNTKIRGNVWGYRTGGHHTTSDNIVSKFDGAGFPEALARDHIISWSNPGDVVLDPMCGSGTTLKMAKELGRQYIGIDISQEYCDLSQRRVDGARIPLPGMIDEPKAKPVQASFNNPGSTPVRPERG